MKNTAQRKKLLAIASVGGLLTAGDVQPSGSVSLTPADGETTPTGDSPL